MICQLSIENYALIKQLNISFDKGFAVITGETGAGKSILLGALSLVLGQRADSQILFDKEKKCLVEATFDLDKLELESFFELNDIDFERYTIVRREILPNAKSRAFVNDTPVNINFLKELGTKLVDIHSQHETLTLNDSKFQLEIIDQLIENQNIIKIYQENFKEYLIADAQLRDLKTKAEELKNNQDYLQFLLEEINDLNPQEDEQQELENKLDEMNHVQEIKGNLLKCVNILCLSDVNVVVALSEINQLLAKTKRFYKPLEEFSDRMQSVFIEIKDITAELERLEGEVLFDPQLQESYKERLDKIYRLETKHKVDSLKDLIKIREALNNSFENIAGYDTKIETLEIRISDLKERLIELSNAITSERKKTAEKIAIEVVDVLKELGMNDAELVIEFRHTEDFKESGRDEIRFLFNANKGREPQLLSKVASGGELSRLMLAIKSTVNNNKILPTIVFDEIDTGVSGDIAGKVAALMQKMSQKIQVIAISHIPQIAAKATRHYKVYKKTIDDITRSEIKELNENEHLQEIAAMLSNDKITNEALSAAKILIN